MFVAYFNSLTVVGEESRVCWAEFAFEGETETKK